MKALAERPPSATAAGQPGHDEAEERRTSPGRRKYEAQWLWAAWSGLSGALVVPSIYAIGFTLAGTDDQVPCIRLLVPRLPHYDKPVS